MSLLLNCQALAKSFGSLHLFEEVSLTVSDGDRLGLIGPNGSGKSTLMKIMAGLETADKGERSLRKGVKLGYVPQDSVFPEGHTVRQVLDLAAKHDDELEGRIQTMLGVVGFDDENQLAARLSGGWRKRLAIAESLIAEPDILLLDEPTNHLDLAGILWLEKLLGNARFAVVAVSHDRYFLENVVNGMAELSRQYPTGMFRADGSYSEFLEKRAAFFEVQEKLQDSLSNRVRREVEWLRRGAKARTTKSKARIDDANRLIGELADVSSRNQTSSVQIDFSASERKSKKLIETTELGCVLGERRLFRGINIKLSPGMRLGLAGGNGSGKTTLLRLIQGHIPPTEGEVFRADNLKIVYFDQNREQLDLDLTLKRALAPYGDSVIYQGRVVHVAGWAKRFLFRTDQLEVKLARLSGGERARVLIARLMVQEADVLLLDEPTNDLDIPTLEVLEESLLEFPGALVLVTHDRYLLDRVSTSILGIDEGTGTLYAEYAQWEASLTQRKSAKPEKSAATPREAKAEKKRLSYKEQREWESMEAAILEAESALEEKHARLNAPDVVSDPKLVQEAYDAMQAAQHHVEALYARWAELEAKVG